MVSLWLVPGPEDTEALKTIMSPQHDTSHLVSKSSYPKFLPHVTLATIPSFDLSEIRNAIPQSQRSFPIKFSSVDVGNHYFRSVYISVELTGELAALHKEFHENIKVPPKTPSFPHCSICYIADEDAVNEEREKFAKELRVAGKVRVDGERSVSLRCMSSAGEEVWMSSYEAKEIWVVQCEGAVEEWKVLDQIKLE
jgi:2'-5' RNA ligase